MNKIYKIRAFCIPRQRSEKDAQLKHTRIFLSQFFRYNQRCNWNGEFYKSDWQVILKLRWIRKKICKNVRKYIFGQNWHKSVLLKHMFPDVASFYDEQFNRILAGMHLSCRQLTKLTLKRTILQNIFIYFWCMFKSLLLYGLQNDAYFRIPRSNERCN